MSIENHQQLENIRIKLKELEDLFAKSKDNQSEDPHMKELTIRSLRKRINQFHEEIVRFETRQVVNGAN